MTIDLPKWDWSLIVSVISLVLAALIFYYQTLKSKQAIYFNDIVTRIEIINELAELACQPSAPQRLLYAKFVFNKNILENNLTLFFSIHHFYHYFRPSLAQGLMAKFNEYIEFIELYTPIETATPLGVNAPNYNQALRRVLLKSSLLISGIQKTY